MNNTVKKLVSVLLVVITIVSIGLISVNATQNVPYGSKTASISLFKTSATAKITKCNCSPVDNHLEVWISYDKDSYGYLITVYFHHIASNRGLDINFIKTVMEKTGIRFISGKRNHFGDNLGFCFRINLAAYNDQFRVAIERSFDYLSKY